MTHRDALSVRAPSVPLSACEGTLVVVRPRADGALYRCEACQAQLIIDRAGMVVVVVVVEADPDALVRELARHFEVRPTDAPGRGGEA